MIGEACPECRSHTVVTIYYPDREVRRCTTCDHRWSYPVKQLDKSIMDAYSSTSLRQED